MGRKEENPVAELAQMIKTAWRHRKGVTIGKTTYKQVKMFGKTIDLDSEIPGLVLDTFDNLGFKTKDEKRPVMVSKRRTDYGWYLLFNLPPGISFKQVKNKENFFADAVKGFVTLAWNGGLVHMDIQTNSLPNYIGYSWDNEPYEHMELPIPIGYTQKGLEVFDLCDSPHLLIGGQTGWGKTMYLHGLANSLIGRAKICISDPKKLDFRYLKNNILLARDDIETFNLLKALNKEYDKRISLLEKADDSITKIQEYDGDLPYIVAILDEVAELSKESMVLVNRLGRLARATGISLVGATQRPSVDVVPGSTRDLFEARLCFKVGSEISSRVILGEEGSMAAWLPPIKGRAIFRFGHEFKEVQTMCLSKEQRKAISRGHEPRGWDFDTGKKLLPN